VPTSTQPPTTFTKPGDHPEFFRFPAPEGASRESTIRLDAEGYFWHDGVKVDHPRLAAALHSWITRHPDNSRFILTNGYDWTYFKVDATPFFVTSVKSSGLDVEPGAGGAIVLTLSDQTELCLEADAVFVDREGALVASISHKNQRFLARFTRFAQAQLAPWVTETSQGEVGLLLGDRVVAPPPLTVETERELGGLTP
jgi:hypothetical protein